MREERSVEGSGERERECEVKTETVKEGGCAFVFWKKAALKSPV